MLTSQKVIDAINEQIGYEFSAELQYYAIAAHFAAEALPQLSQHFFQQAEEEKGHALRFISQPALRHRHLRGIYLQVVTAGEVKPLDPVRVLSRPLLEARQA